MRASSIRYSGYLEMREAARFALIPWHEFVALSEDDQAGVIAHYRTINRINEVDACYRAEQARIAARGR